MEVFVISMNDDRYQSAETNLIGSGFLKSQIVRFPAVVGTTIDLNDESLVHASTKTYLLNKENNSQPYYDTKINHGQLIPSKGALGCYLSHYHLWKQTSTNYTAMTVNLLKKIAGNLYNIEFITNNLYFCTVLMY